MPGATGLHGLPGLSPGGLMALQNILQQQQLQQLLQQQQAAAAGVPSQASLAAAAAALGLQLPQQLQLQPQQPYMMQGQAGMQHLAQQVPGIPGTQQQQVVPGQIPGQQQVAQSHLHQLQGQLQQNPAQLQQVSGQLPPTPAMLQQQAYQPTQVQLPQGSMPLQQAPSLGSLSQTGSLSNLAHPQALPPQQYQSVLPQAHQLHHQPPLIPNQPVPVEQLQGHPQPMPHMGQPGQQHSQVGQPGGHLVQSQMPGDMQQVQVLAGPDSTGLPIAGMAVPSVPAGLSVGQGLPAGAAGHPVAGLPTVIANKPHLQSDLSRTPSPGDQPGTQKVIPQQATSGVAQQSAHPQQTQVPAQVQQSFQPSQAIPQQDASMTGSGTQASLGDPVPPTLNTKQTIQQPAQQVLGTDTRINRAVSEGPQGTKREDSPSKISRLEARHQEGSQITPQKGVTDANNVKRTQSLKTEKGGHLAPSPRDVNLSSNQGTPQVSPKPVRRQTVSGVAAAANIAQAVQNYQAIHSGLAASAPQLPLLGGAVPPGGTPIPTNPALQGSNPLLEGSNLQGSTPMLSQNLALNQLPSAPSGQISMEQLALNNSAGVVGGQPILNLQAHISQQGLTGQPQQPIYPQGTTQVLPGQFQQGIPAQPQQALATLQQAGQSQLNAAVAPVLPAQTPSAPQGTQ